MSSYPVVEKFVSINGEGPRAGELSVFIRFKYCNLNCSYCDTKWANNADCKAEYLDQRQITEYVVNTGIQNVTLTGGEPLIQKDIFLLIKSLLKAEKRVEIETNGSIYIKDFAHAPFRPVFTMDYKLPSSGMENYMDLKNFDLLQSEDTIKFVVGSNNDLIRAFDIISEYSLSERCHVYLSPVFGSIRPDEIVEFMKDHKLNNTRLQLQLHKYIWEPNARGV